MIPVSTPQLIDSLKRYHSNLLGPMARLKQVYRPLICPYESLLPLIPDRKRVLDIGCGIGTFLLLVAEYRTPTSLAGIETKQSLIETSQSILGEFFPDIPHRFHVYDGVNFPDWVREYNYVLLVDVLHHIPRPLQSSFLAQLYDQLESGATLIIKEINAEQSFWCLFNQLHDLLVSGERTHETGLTDLMSSVSKIGYKIRESMTQRVYVYPHFTIVCEKP